MPAGGMMPDALSDRLAACYTGVLHDVMRAAGLRDFTLPPELRPLIPERALAGPVFTIEGKVVEGADAHETLLAWTGLLSQAPAGSLWVSQPNDRVVAHMGELSAETLKNKGVRGCVVDGFIRDVNFLLAIGFQSWSRGHTPRDIVGHWLPAATEVPITIGEVLIAPGDYLVGDRDGLVRVPRADAEAIAGAAEAAIATESLVRKAILAGTDPREAYLRYGKF
jgi:4-hydroxy-4-methyl-2-oxoglutarate aldolase